MKFPIFLVCCLFLLIGCGPYKKEIYEEVAPNETAFLVAMEDNDQGKFESVKFL